MLFSELKIDLEYTKLSGGEWDNKKGEFTQAEYLVSLTVEDRTEKFPYFSGGGNTGIPIKWEEIENGFGQIVRGKPIKWQHKQAPRQHEKPFKIRPIPPQADDVLQCLQSDCQSGGLTHQEFCEEFGYDSDSIEQRDIYLKCQDSLNKLRKLFGANFNNFMELVEEE